MKIYKSAILVAFGFLFFAQWPSYGAEVVEDIIQGQIIEIGKRIDELENRLNSIVNNRLPTKIEFCGERVPQERGYVRERLEKEIIFLSRKQFTFYLKRSEKYFPYIEKRIKELKLPDCLKYIAVIESALMPNALSSANAYGPWQFISGTAKRYGLNSGLNFDERANFEKATDAALSYLKDNYSEFGKWALALASYNAGEATIEAAVKRQKTSDYYDLLLPAETMQYNYRAIAAYLVMSKPELYGFSLKEQDLYRWPDTKEITLVLSKPKSVIDIAVDLKISVNEFLWLNPKLKMPAGKRPFRENIRSFVLSKGTYTFKVPRTP